MMFDIQVIIHNDEKIESGIVMKRMYILNVLPRTRFDLIIERIRRLQLIETIPAVTDHMIKENCFTLGLGAATR